MYVPYPTRSLAISEKLFRGRRCRQLFSCIVVDVELWWSQHGAKASFHTDYPRKLANEFFRQSQLREPKRSRRRHQARLQGHSRPQA